MSDQVIDITEHYLKAAEAADGLNFCREFTLEDIDSLRRKVRAAYIRGYMDALRPTLETDVVPSVTERPPSLAASNAEKPTTDGAIGLISDEEERRNVRWLDKRLRDQGSAIMKRQTLNTKTVIEDQK